MQSPKPLSPHLQIYRQPLTAILSVLHRATGTFLTLGLVVVTIWLVSAAVDRVIYESVLALLSSWIGQIILLGGMAALYLHLGNGIRHLFWDAGYGFELQTANRSTIGVLVFTLIATTVTWLCILMTRGVF